MTETIVPSTSQRLRARCRMPLIDRAAAALASTLAGRWEYGTLVLRDREGGRSAIYGSGQPRAELTINDQRAYTAILARGSVGFGRSYVDGDWDCDDLTALVRIIMRNLEGVGRIADRWAPIIARPVWSRSLRRRDRDSDRRDIRAHYDLDNRFFELMLDSTMMYSCGLFERPDLTLEEASTAKLDQLCRRLDLGPNDHVVEIGTGWGGFAVHAASHYGSRVTTTTISEAQYDYAAKRVADAGLGSLIAVRNDDYRDLSGTYDKLVSIEMIEAIGWQQLDTFFSTCSHLLSGGGLMAVQSIVITEGSYERAKYHDDFIKRMIFPGGCLPSIGAITRSCTHAGDLRVLQINDIGIHYAETLRRWRANFEARLDQVSALGFDESFQRLWRLYLCYCEAAFIERHVSDVQMVLAKPRCPAANSVWWGGIRRGGSGRLSGASEAVDGVDSLTGVESRPSVGAEGQR